MAYFDSKYVNPLGQNLINTTQTLISILKYAQKETNTTYIIGILMKQL